MMREVLRHQKARRLRTVRGEMGSGAEVESNDGGYKWLSAYASSKWVLGTHVAQVQLGSQRTKLSLVFDTASDLTWTQCSGCKECYKQRETMFDPSKSSALPLVECGPEQGPHQACLYDVGYAEESHSQGSMMKAQLWLDPSSSRAVLDDFIFGCGNSSNFSGREEAGVMGLGPGLSYPSIVSQANATFSFRFSYCLTTESGRDGYLSFGSSPPASGVVYANLYIPDSGFYFIRIVDIMVNGRSLGINSAVFKSPGTIIDSGSAISLLPQKAFTALNSAFEYQMSRLKYKKVALLAGDKDGMLNTCYDFTKGTPKFPTISYVFDKNTVLHLPPAAVMLKLSANDASQVCLAFAPTARSSDLGVFGNIQQQTMGVFYDLDQMKVAFTQNACT
ncbi:unnamed protein product [Cuscuta epithymum]|uniref:Peptidase A1 domain-containing protein n=1 Tax=Cuscuta epithymum TaxID=186058 RepID=A0AAV0FBN2_9ASTE|nr:unnamed protein product [Cuscuta epithymum]